MDSQGGNLRRLTGDQEHDVRPTWSPDGTMIAFESDRDGDLDIYIVDASGGSVRQLTDQPGVAYSPDWSPTRFS